MASLFRFSRNSLRSAFCLSSKLTGKLREPFRSLRPELPQIRTFSSETTDRSPFDSNIIRILRAEIDYQAEYTPPDTPPSCFNFFAVEDLPGEQFVRLRRKFEGKEDIKIEATMFDGCVSVPRAGDDSDAEDIHLHISLLVDIHKGEGSDGLGFVCSAWPDGLEIMKVYMLCGNGMLPKAYMGPNLRNLDPKLQKALHEYLEARGVNDELSFFLHRYMINKDRIELLRWDKRNCIEILLEVHGRLRVVLAKNEYKTWQRKPSPRSKRDCFQMRILTNEATPRVDMGYKAFVFSEHSGDDNEKWPTS